MSIKEKKPITLNWDDFKQLGNPDNAPEMDTDEDANENHIPAEEILRLYLDKKKRNGKSVTIIKGFKGDEVLLKKLGKELKSACGVGGTVKNGDILIQGNHRNKLLEILLKKGYKNTKLVGG